MESRRDGTTEESQEYHLTEEEKACLARGVVPFSVWEKHAPSVAKFNQKTMLAVETVRAKRIKANSSNGNGSNGKR